MLLTAACALFLTAHVATGLGPAGAQSARASVLYERAADLEKQGNHAAALTLLWEAAGLAPTDPDILNRLGEALDRLGALDASIDAFKRALAARPVFPKAANNLILVLVRAGKGPEAVERARELIAKAPTDPEAYFTLGLAQAEQDVREAIRTFTRVVELAPGHTLARYNLALVLKREDRLTEAIEQLKRAIAIEPRAESNYTLGVIYLHLGELDRAADALREAIRIDSRHTEAHHSLGAVLKAKRDWTGAAAALRRAIAIRPDLWGAHYTLGQVLQQSGDESAAQRHLAEADRLRRRAQLEQEAGVWTAVGTAKFDQGDLHGALECFTRATALVDVYAPPTINWVAFFKILDDATNRAAFTRASIEPWTRFPRRPRIIGRIPHFAAIETASG